MSILLPGDPDIIILGYNPMYFALSLFASLILLFIWEIRTGGDQ